ncbi:MAG: cbb3-type cytochrome c oxidase subunit 3 [Bacteroidota bacterium]
MYKDVLRSIPDAGLFPAIAIVIFMLFFVGLLIYVSKLTKKEVAHMSDIPLQDQPVNVRVNSPSPNGKANL